MIDGLPIIMGGKEYILPNLNLRALQKVAPFLKDFHLGGGEEQITAMIKIITASLQRNYPNLTEEEVADAIEDYELTPIVEAINTQFTRKKTVSAASPSIASIGDASTPSS